MHYHKQEIDNCERSVICVGDRFFYGFGAKKQVKTAWSIGGAKYFLINGPAERIRFDALLKKIAKTKPGSTVGEKYVVMTLYPF